MVQYIKVSLYKKDNGAFKGYGVIVKAQSYTLPVAAFFHFVAKDGVFNFPGTTINGNPLVFGNEDGTGTSFSSSSALRYVRFYTGNSVDSFETVMLAERLRSDSIFANYRVVLGEEVFSDNSGVFTVDFDDLFIREMHQEAVASGCLIKQGYTQNNIYSGFYGYHHSPGRGHFNTPLDNQKPYRIGIELEVYARTQADYNRITTSRTNWFMCEADSSLSQHQWPIEIKTIPLRPVDATSVDFWNEPMKKLAQSALSKDFTSTGLHVHISKEIFGCTESERKRNLNKLITFYTYYVEDDPAAHEKNKTICGRELGYHCTRGMGKTPIGDFAKLVGINEVSKNDEAFRILSESISTAIHGERGDINLGNWDSYGTVEFRKGKGAISKTRMAAICTWWEQMCLYCKETHPRDFSFENFFNRICRDYPAVAYFFQQDEEC